MTTTSGARVYRGAPPPRDRAEACPACHRIIGATPSGRWKLHRDLDGVDCTGSGVLITAAPVEVQPEAVYEAWRDAAEETRWKARDRSKPANPWSGKEAP